MSTMTDSEYVSTTTSRYGANPDSVPVMALTADSECLAIRLKLGSPGRRYPRRV